MKVHLSPLMREILADSDARRRLGEIVALAPHWLRVGEKAPDVLGSLMFRGRLYQVRTGHKEVTA